MLKKWLLSLILVLLLTAVTACGFDRPGPDKEKVPGESQVVNRMGDLRVRGEALFYTPPAAEEKEGTTQVATSVGRRNEGQGSGRTSGTSDGGTSTEAPARAGSGGGVVSSGRAAIEQYYTGRLRSLASGYESQIMGLYSQGIQEIQSIPASDSQSRSVVAGQYYASGRALEAKCDGQFYQILAGFEGELQSNGYPLDKAHEAQAVYESSKQARAGQLFGMAMNSAGGSKKQ